MMPPGGAASRGDQIATIKSVRHNLLIDPEIGDLLATAETARALEPWQRANLREMRRSWRHATALNEDLVAALAKSTSACEAVWRTARDGSDFSAVALLLEEVLRLVREGAQAKGEAFGCEPYDALLDTHAPGIRSQEIEQLFTDIEATFPEFLREVMEHQAAAPATLQPQAPFSAESQDKLGRLLMGQIGFDFSQGRLDISMHPFSSGTPEDLRITTRYDEADFVSGIMGVLHETGHALYEKGLPQDWRSQPVGTARGMDVHESQSLIIEMQACRSREFFTFAGPLMREAFNAEGPAWEPDNLFRLYTRVNPDFIRVDADEVTYPAHIILRHNLERALIADDLTIKELPSAWSEGMQRLLGLNPPDHRRGCLQDIHWYDGAFGYFPSYTLGAMMAAQLFDAAVQDIPGIPSALAKGNFAPLMNWLGEHVHGMGSRYDTPELIERATGRPLDPTIFKAHLARRYLD